MTDAITSILKMVVLQMSTKYSYSTSNPSLTLVSQGFGCKITSIGIRTYSNEVLCPMEIQPRVKCSYWVDTMCFTLPNTHPSVAAQLSFFHSSCNWTIKAVKNCTYMVKCGFTPIYHSSNSTHHFLMWLLYFDWTTILISFKSEKEQATRQ